MRLQWRPIPILDESADINGLTPDGAWQAHRQFRWQLVHWIARDARPGTPDRSERFELTCFALRNLGGWNACFPGSAEAHADANRIEVLAAARRRVLSSPGSSEVVLWPEGWEIITTSREITDRWACPACDSTLPAYKVETAESKDQFWVCSSCSMPFDWRDSPERFRLTELELDRLEAKDLETEWGVGVAALEERQFFIEDDLAVSAVHALRHVWLPSAASTRTVLCCEKDEDGQLRWLIFINNQEKLAILVEADEGEASYLGYFVDFVEPIERLRLISRWDYESGWVDQLPDPQVFWLEDGVLRDDPDIDTKQIKALLFPDQESGLE